MVKAIKVQTQDSVVPIEFGDLVFQVALTDENFKKFQESSVKLSEMESQGVPMEEVLREGYDLVLGAGAYEKLFAKFGSTLLLSNYFIQMSAGIIEHMETIANESNDIRKSMAAEKYLTKQKGNRQQRRNNPSKRR